MLQVHLTSSTQHADTHGSDEGDEVDMDLQKYSGSSPEAKTFSSNSFASETKSIFSISGKGPSADTGVQEHALPPSEHS